MDTASHRHTAPFTVETVRMLADLSIRRGCGFWLLGVVCVMVGLSYDIGLAFRTGAILLGMLTVILYFRGLDAPTRPFRKTEVWLMIDERPQIGETETQRLIGGTIGERLMWHARISAVVTLWLAAIGFGLAMFGA